VRKECTTHHHACDCREVKFAEMRVGLEAATEIINSHCQHIAELEAERHSTDLLIARINHLEQQLAELDKQAQGYYNEASEGWSKYRKAEQQLAEQAAQLEAEKIRSAAILESIDGCAGKVAELKQQLTALRGAAELLRD